MANDNHADFTPTIPDSGITPERAPYVPVGSFKFWAQKVLPSVYDDSLSYYEVLTKLTYHINKMIEDMDNFNQSIENQENAFQELQTYTNNTKNSLITAYNELQSYVNHYFDNLDVQSEINNKLDRMAESGELDAIIQPHIADSVISWLEDNVDPSIATPVDESLTVAGMAADSHVTGIELKSKITGKTGNNAFDKSGKHNIITQNYYRDYTTGVKTENNGWSVVEIVASYGEYYSFNIYNLHICFFSDYNCNNYIRGVRTSANEKTVAIPSGTKMMTVSYPTAEASNLMVSKGRQNYPIYQNYEFGEAGNEVVVGYDNHVLGTQGKNLFDVSGKHTPIVSGYYRPYDDGTWAQQPNFSTAIFYLHGERRLCINYNNIHVSFYSDEYATKYISGFLVNVSNGSTFEVPPNAITMCVSYSTDIATLLMVERGYFVSDYYTYQFGTPSKDIIKSLTYEYENKINGTCGINLFDKTGKHTKIEKGFYRQYNDGIKNTLDTHFACYFKVKSREKYIINAMNAHICFFTDENATVYDRGLLSDTARYSFSVPDHCCLMSISVPISFIDSFMVQHGTVLTPIYFPYEYGVSSEIKTIGNSEYIKGRTGKNLYDKSGQRTFIIPSYFRDFRDGAWVSHDYFECAIFYNVSENTTYSISGNNVHVCFFKDEYATEYISGYLVNAENGNTFTTPALTKSMSVSLNIALKDSLQVEKNNSVTDYEEYKFGMDAKNIFGLGGSSIKTVGANKSFQTIQDAINASNSGDCIVIDEGDYYESLECVNKTLHFIGSGKNATRVIATGGDYYHPPLNIATGIVENMSFITTSSELDPGATSLSYCVHIDWDQEIGKSLQFVNCYFESPIKHCVGIGLRENFILNFTNCTFKSLTAPVYCHEEQANNKSGQKIELIDCSIECTGNEACIYLQESRAYTGNTMTILMQRCIAKSQGISGDGIIIGRTYPNAEMPTGSNYLNMNGWYLAPMSAMNNESILNA